eukprot:UN31298
MYRKALTYKPKHVKTYFKLGNLLNDHFADYTKAREYYETAIRLSPDYVDVYINLGNLLSDQLEDYSSALKSYEKALQLQPDDVDAHYNLGLLYRDNFSDTESALDHFQKGIKLSPSDFDLRYAYALSLCILAHRYEGKGLLRTALTYYDKAFTYIIPFIFVQNNEIRFKARKHFVTTTSDKITTILTKFKNFDDKQWSELSKKEKDQENPVKFSPHIDIITVEYILERVHCVNFLKSLTDKKNALCNNAEEAVL